MEVSGSSKMIAGACQEKKTSQKCTVFTATLTNCAVPQASSVRSSPHPRSFSSLRRELQPSSCPPVLVFQLRSSWLNVREPAPSCFVCESKLCAAGPRPPILRAMRFEQRVRHVCKVLAYLAQFATVTLRRNGPDPALGQPSQPEPRSSPWQSGMELSGWRRRP